VTRGIYILTNDATLDHAIALLSSIRARDSATPIVMIPYDDRSQQAATVLGRHFGVTPYEDTDLLEGIDSAVRRNFGADFFWRPTMFRKQAAWFGPFDEFLYLDADIVVFERVIDNLDHLSDCDFLCCDNQHEHEGGLRYIFTSEILVDRVFARDVLRDVFNGGWWASKKGVLKEEDLWANLEECARHRDYFDFATGVCDQPILNYLVLKRLARRRNLFRYEARAPRMWAGTAGFKRRGDLLVDPAVGRSLKFLHWAGTPLGPGHPYWRVWKHYRLLRPDLPRQLSLPVKNTKGVPWGLFILRLLVKSRRFTLAARLEQRLELLTPEVRQIAEWYYLTALCFQNSRNRRREALSRYRLALEFGYHEFLVRYNRGVLHAQLHNNEEARADLLRAVLLKPDHADAQRLLGQLPVKHGGRPDGFEER